MKIQYECFGRLYDVLKKEVTSDGERKYWIIGDDNKVTIISSYIFVIWKEIGEI